MCVCYNDYENTKRLLNSISIAYSREKNLELNVILSDNSDKNEEIEFDSNSYKYNFIWLKNDNVGYFPAFSKAVQSVRHDISYYDYIMVSNVDLAVDEYFFNDLVKFKCPKDVGVIAPNIISESDGRNLNPKIAKPISSFKLKVNKLIFSSFLFYPHSLASRLKNKLKSKKKPEINSQDKPSFIYAPHGSFIIFTNNYFKKEASYIYPRFLFGEEIFVAEECKLKNLKIIYVQTIKIYDKEHVSTSALRSNFLAQEHIKSFDYLLKKYFNTVN